MHMTPQFGVASWDDYVVGGMTNGNGDAENKEDTWKRETHEL